MPTDRIQALVDAKRKLIKRMHYATTQKAKRLARQDYHFFVAYYGYTKDELNQARKVLAHQ